MSSFPVKDSEYYPKIRIHKESLIRGCIVLYKPDLEHCLRYAVEIIDRVVSEP